MKRKSNSKGRKVKVTTPRFGKHLRHVRAKKGWSVEEAATALGYSEQQWRNYEFGTQHPTLERLETLCAALEMDLLETLRLYFQETLDGSDTMRTQAILGKWNQQTASGTAALARMQERLNEVPLDNSTGDCIVDIVALLMQYRKRLTVTSGTGKDLKVVCVNDSIYWTDIEGSKLVKQHVINLSKTGLGHIATVLRIPADSGGYHFHADGPYVDAGREFFAVLSGEGVLFVQHPADKSWRRYKLSPGTVGTYPGNCGHCFVNTSRHGGVPLHAMIVAVPFPPPIRDVPRVHGGNADAKEFRILEIAHAAVPADLRRIIIETFENPIKSVSEVKQSALPSQATVMTDSAS